MINKTNNLKVEKVNFYSEVNPEFVDFNDLDIPYEEALENAKTELNNLISNCNTYEDVREIMTTKYEDLIFSEENGYVVQDNTTGRLYLTWCVIYGDDLTKTIFWDVRHY